MCWCCVAFLQPVVCLSSGIFPSPIVFNDDLFLGGKFKIVNFLKVRHKNLRKDPVSIQHGMRWRRLKEGGQKAKAVICTHHTYQSAKRRQPIAS